MSKNKNLEQKYNENHSFAKIYFQKFGTLEVLLRHGYKVVQKTKFKTVGIAIRDPTIAISNIRSVSRLLEEMQNLTWTFFWYS